MTGALMALVIIELAAITGRNIQPVPPLLIGHGRFSAAERNQSEKFLFVGEGMNSSPAVSRDANGSPELPQRRQGAGIQPAPGHAAAAHARPHDDAAPSSSPSRCW
jgi:hypothetical protein